MNKLSKNPLTYILVFFILLSLFAIHDYAVVYCKMQNLVVDSVWKNIYIYYFLNTILLYIFVIFIKQKSKKVCNY